MDGSRQGERTSPYSDELHSRTALLLGTEGVEKLVSATVAVFGLGGVGSFAAEALVRAGVGTIVAVDNDIVAESNLNRQLIALQSTLGRQKVNVFAERALDINPAVRIITHPLFVDKGSISFFDFSSWDYVLDCVDTVTAKLLIIERARDAGIPVLSCLGTGNKLDPSRLEVSEIEKTSVCPLARVMRRELRARGIRKVPVLYSREEPVPVVGRVPGSISFVPSVAGLTLAGVAIRAITER